MPYYLHQLDRVAGAAHFEVPVETGRRIIAELRARLPGYAVPAIRAAKWPASLQDVLSSTRSTCSEQSISIQRFARPMRSTLRAELKFEPRRLRAAADRVFQEVSRRRGGAGGVAGGGSRRVCPPCRVSSARRRTGVRFAGRRRDEAGAADRGRVADRIGHHADRHRPRVAVRVVASRLRGGVRVLRDRPNGHRPQSVARPRSSTKSCSPASGSQPKAGPSATSCSWAWASRFTTKRRSTKRSRPCWHPSCSTIRRAAS